MIIIYKNTKKYYVLHKIANTLVEENKLHNKFTFIYPTKFNLPFIVSFHKNLSFLTQIIYLKQKLEFSLDRNFVLHIVDLKPVISVSNVDTFKVEETYLILQLKLQGTITTGRIK